MSEYKMLKKVCLIGLGIMGVSLAFKTYRDSYRNQRPSEYLAEDMDEEELADECANDDDMTDAWAVEILDAAAEASTKDD